MLKGRIRLEVRDLLIFGAFFILVLIWFKDVIFYSNIFSYADLGRYFYPIREFAADSIKNGHIPLWNPYLQNGTPFLAILQGCIFYPVSIVYYLSGSFEGAFNWYIILHFFLGAVFMYILMRYWDFSKAASSISSLVFVFGGYLSSVINMNTSLSSVIWLPLVFLFFDMTLRRKRLAPAMLTGIFLSIQFLGGEPTIIYSTLWLLFLYFLGFCFFSYKNIKDIIRSSFLFLVAVSLWVFITSIQLLPFLELLLNSTRGQPEGFKFVTHWSLSPAELLSFFIPHILGNTTVPAGHFAVQDWITSFYIGIMPIILILFGLFAKPNKKTKFFGIILTISLILALGKYTPLYRLLHRYIFGFAYIRYPVKFLFLSGFALSVLSGMGYETLSNIKDDKIKEGLTKRLLLLNGLLGLLLITFLRFLQPLYDYVKSSFPEMFFSPTQHKIFYVVFLSGSAHACRLFIIFTIAVSILIMYLNKKIKLSVFNFLILSVIFLDLASVNVGLSEIVGVDIFKKEPPSFSKIMEDEGLFRIIRSKEINEINRAVWGLDFALGQYERKATFDGNTAMVYRIHDSQGYGSIFRRDNAKFMTLISGRPSKLVDLLNIKYVISTDPIEEEGYSQVFKDKVARLPLRDEKRVYTYFYINENTDYMERAFLVKDAKVVGDREEIPNILKDKDFDPTRLIILEEEPILKKTADKRRISKEDVHILSYKPEEIIIEVALYEPKFLVLSDSYYPGWKVYVDGRPDKIYRAYYFLRSVYLDRGRHIVKFIYDPISYKAGKYISLSTIGLLLLLGLVNLLKRKKTK